MENDLWGRLGPGEFLYQLTMDGAVEAQRLVADLQERWRRHQPSLTDQPVDFATDSYPASGAPRPEEAQECPDCGLCF